MKISYAITVCNEHEELNRLLMFLTQHKRKEDEIVIQCDKGNTTLEVYNLLKDYQDEVIIVEAYLDKDFASFKNKLGEACSGHYIFQIDADEIPTEYLIKNLHEIISLNDSEVILVPRINTVKGLTQEHIQKWGWKVSKLENYVEEKEFDLDNPQDLDEYNLLKQNGLIIEEISLD
jgi:GT2 family glycosyltransferase